MDNFLIVKSFQTSYHLDEIKPYLLLWHLGYFLFIRGYFSKQVSSTAEFHDKAEVICAVFKESFFKSDQVYIIDRSENSDFIERIFLLFLAE